MKELPASPTEDSTPPPSLRRPSAPEDDDGDELLDSESISDDEDEPPVLEHAGCGDEAPPRPPVAEDDGEEPLDSVSTFDEDEPPALVLGGEAMLIADEDDEEDAACDPAGSGDDASGDELVHMAEDEEEEDDGDDEPPVTVTDGGGEDAMRMAKEEEEAAVLEDVADGTGSDDASGGEAVHMAEEEEEDDDDDDEPPVTVADGGGEDAIRMAKEEEEAAILEDVADGAGSDDVCGDEAVQMAEDEEEDEPPVTEHIADVAGIDYVSGDEAVRMAEDEPPVTEKAADIAAGHDDASGDETVQMAEDEEEVTAVPEHAVTGEDALEDEAVQATEDEQSLPVPAGTTVKRKRGRPRKVRVENALAEEAVEMVEDEAETPAATVKRRRGRPPKAHGGRRALVARKKEKEEEEAVCFICFDGGDLVICDRRGCTKVYHAGCVNKDESYFHTKGRWNCGWHICSSCEKAAHFMCYTCTYSLCKTCNRGARFVCIRGNKGFCESCYTTVMTIESNEHSDEEQVDVNINDKTSWDYLFKIYWSRLKGKLSLTSDELTAAKNRRNKYGVVASHEDSSDESYHVNDDQEISSDSSSERYEGRSSSRKKIRRRSQNAGDEDSSVKQVENGGISTSDNSKWASKELLEFVSHMKDGDTSSLSQFDVQALILEYIKKNNLRDPRKKSQIICDPMLQKLFQKERVGHFEMLKLLESHFLMKEASQVITDHSQGGVLNTNYVQVDDEGFSDAAAKFNSDKKRKTRKRVEEREPQTNVDDYAAIDVHNINLMYLRRSLMEELVEDDTDSFSEKVIGSFVRIRIPATDHKQDIYRLVQVVGTHVAAEKYKIGKKTTDIILEILNLDKTEAVTIETVSNQEFTEEECRRLRQSIKCGLISRLTVGQVQEKARILQAVRVDDWLENEKLRVGHLRDRASEKGRRKELRECVEKLQLLNTPEERWRRLNDVPEIHADPKMDPAYESVDEEESDDKNQDNFRKSNGSFSLRIGRHLPFPGKGGSVSSSSWNSARKSSQTHSEVNRSPAVEGAWDKMDSFSVGDKTSELFSLQGKAEGHFSKVAQNTQANTTGMEAGGWNKHAVIPEQSYGVARETTTASPPPGVPLPSVTSETEKMWYYHDPSGKVQGPFSMTQLRKWNTTGYFPPELWIWRTSDKQDDYVLLTDALIGKFQKDLSQWESQHNSFPQPIKVATAMDSMNSAWVGNNQNQGNWNTVQENAIFPSSGNTEAGNTIMWSNQSIIWSPKTEVANPMEGRIGSRSWEASRDANTWSGQAQPHSSFRPTAPFSGNNYEPIPPQGRGGRGGNAGRWNRGQDCGSLWNLNRLEGLRSNGQGYERRQSNWNTSGQQPANDSKNNWGNDLFNPPTPTPHPARGGWANVQGIVNASSASLTASQHTGVGHGSTQSTWKDVAHCFPPESNKEAMANTVGAWDPYSASPSMPGNAKRTDGWGSWSPISHKGKVSEPVNTSPTPEISSGWGNQQTFSEQKRPQCNASGTTENEWPLPMGRTNVSDSAIITSGSSIAELSGTLNKNQFFQGECPSPTPLCERQELLVVQEDDRDPATAAPALGASDPCANLCSEMDNGLHSALTVAADTSAGIEPTIDSDSAQRPGASSGLKSVSETEGRDPALYQKGEPSASSSVPSEKCDMQQSQKRIDINASDWSPPSPTPSTEPPSWDLGVDSTSVNRQSNPWVSSDGSKLSPTTPSGTGWDHHPVPQNASKSIGATQGDTKGGWGKLGESLPQANTDTNTKIGCGAPSQGNINENTGWGASTRGNKNTSSGWGVTSPGSTNAGAGRTSSMPGNTGWGAPLQGSTNRNTGWEAPPNGNTVNPDWGLPTQGNSNQNTGWGVPANESAANSSWGVPAQGNINQNPGWGNQNQNVNWGAPAPLGNGNVNGGWVAGHGNRSSWGAHQSGDRYDRGDNGTRNSRMQSGGGGGLSRPRPRQGQTGICKFHESGHCKKGSSCNYRHI